MALTVTKTRSGVIGDLRYFAGSVTFDSSYPTGGEAIAKSDFGFSGAILQVVVNPANDAAFKVTWDPSTSKLLVFEEDDTSGVTAEAADSSDQSGVTTQVFVLGI